MASYGEVEESLDFDFFESPRHQNEDVHLKSPTSKPPKGLEPDSKQRASDKSVLPKSSHSDKSRSPSVSASDSYSSDPASEIDIGPSHNKTKEDTDHKKKSKLKKTSSNSSFSSTGSNSSRSRSLSRHSRSLSRSGSDRDGSDKSKSDSSLSSDRDTERPSNPVAKSPASSMPKRGRSRLGEDEYSSSAYSEGEDEKNSPSESSRKDSKHKDSAKKDKIKHMQAWSERPSSNTKPKTRDSKTRPKTANARASGSTRSTLASSGRMHRGSQAKSDSETLSDSDITDVSPMDSPRIQGGSAAISNKRGRDGKGKGGRVSASGDGAGDKTHKFMALPVNGLELGEDGGDELQPSRHSRDDRDASGLDLEILMKAVGELEKQKRVQANSRRVMFAPMGASREKNNYTFDQSKTRDIERENQRLLNEIVRRVNSTTDQKKQFYASPKPTYKLTPSAINRERDMKRIESENMVSSRFTFTVSLSFCHPLSLLLYSILVISDSFCVHLFCNYNS